MAFPPELEWHTHSKALAAWNHLLNSARKTVSPGYWTILAALNFPYPPHGLTAARTAAKPMDSAKLTAWVALLSWLSEPMKPTHWATCEEAVTWTPPIAN